MNTKKKGYIKRNLRTLSGKTGEKTQRYFCNDCKKYFSLRKHKRLRYSKNFTEEALRRYVEDNTSFRTIARRMNVSRTTVLKWVGEAGKACKDTIETNLELKPCWSGILGIDGKPIAIAGGKDTVLAAADRRTKDLIHFRIAEEESEKDFRAFLFEIRDTIEYPLTGLVSDLGKGRVLVKLIANIFPDIPHQICVLHFKRYVDFILPKSKKSPHYKENTSLRRIINNLLFAPSLEEANYLRTFLLERANLFRVSYQKAIIKSVISHYPLLTKHFHYQHLPRDNNVAESVVKQLNKKLKMAEGYQTRETAYNHLKLWALSYRFKPFSDSRTKENNGKSPLELAQVDTSRTNWLEFSKAINRLS